DVRDLEIGRHVERARVRLQIAAHEREQARFAAAVLASDAHFLAPKQPECGVGKEQAGAATARPGRGIEDGRTSRGGEPQRAAEAIGGSGPQQAHRYVPSTGAYGS